MSGAGVVTAVRQGGRWVSPPKRVDALVLFTLPVLAALALAGAFGGSAWLRRSPASAPAEAAYVVEGATLRVPAAWAGGNVSAEPVPAARIDLVIPARDLIASPAAFLNDETVGVTLVPADGGLSPAERPAQLYARFLSAAAQPVPGPLIRREFRAGTPYQGEALHLAPPEGRAFAARCVEGAAAKGLAGPCLAELRLGGFDLRIRLTRALLPHWEALTRALAGRFATGS